MDDGARRARRIGDHPRVPGAGRRRGERSKHPSASLPLASSAQPPAPGTTAAVGAGGPPIGAVHAALAKDLRAAHGVELTTTGA